MNKGVQKIYAEAAYTYEMINHLLTFWLDILWRRKTSQIALRIGGIKWLDVCSGTGEMATNLREVSNSKTVVTSADFSLPMLRIGKSKPTSDGIHFTLADAGALPFADDSFDLITISYATRNLNPNRAKMIEYLKEFHRILRPGGTFINLETSQPDSLMIRNLYHLYVRMAVRRIGQFISGSKTGYNYLSYTVPRFYNPFEFANVLKEAGFSDVRLKRMLFGAFAIHQAKA
ncbi:MAG: ubiquinone/menaquinone biosynthesis methyltransferase [Candidatus Thorarchaeota archaeon]|nr:ubiquinone/menaquinone biosynthesis methyltransferase [Candidatus Thorarchaeota archaeon]